MTAKQQAAAIDHDRHALAWYGQPLAFLVAHAGLRPLRDASAPAWAQALPGVASGHVVAISSSLVEPPRGAAVTGGPCMGDGALGPTVEALHDVVRPLLLARHLEVRCVLYLGDREEILGAGGEGKWAKTTDRFEAWIPRVAEALGLARPIVVRTSSPAHEDALERSGRPSRGAEPAAIDAAFHLGAPSQAPEQSEVAREVTRRVVDAHLPDVIGAHLSSSAAPHVVIAENLQQAGVAALARDLAAARGQSVSFVAHWPAPSLSASLRMYRAAPWDKVPAWDVAALARGEIGGAHPRTTAYFAAWLDDEARTRLALASKAW